MTDRLPATTEGIAAASAILTAGGLVAFPTDTVYGLGCAASRPEAIEAVYALKRRPPEKRVAILVSGLDAVDAGAWDVDDRARLLATRFWPGALSLVLPARDDDATQSFRAPDHPVALALIENAGPMYVTSANVSDEPDTLDADDVLIAFATQADGLAAVVDGGRVPGGMPSTVLDLTAGMARILRSGPVSEAMLAEVVELAPAPID
ncbi:MAG TPA: L-threonylcarbamoyladenylate synthase [Candidatus Limnocylindria bacterium]|jgi:L-threonylcarbamoyladenylate synthase